MLVSQFFIFNKLSYRQVPFYQTKMNQYKARPINKFIKPYLTISYSDPSKKMIDIDILRFVLYATTFVLFLVLSNLLVFLIDAAWLVC